MEIPGDSEELRKELNNFFGHDNFISDDQERATNEVFKGENDVYIALHPGAGKSICFQLPAVLKKNKLTVVIVPTRNLARNEVDLLKRKCINAEYLDLGTANNVRQAVLKDLQSHEMKLKILYASTDKFTGDLINDLIIDLRARNALGYIVFDEAHCISRLSHDYVSTYREVAKLIRLSCPNIRKIAVTGIATDEVGHDIIRELGMMHARQIFTTCQWGVYHDVYFIDSMKEPPYKHLREFIFNILGPEAIRSSENIPKCGIIFCRKKIASKIVAKELEALNIPVVSYHGDLSLKERKSIHERWMSGDISVIATTRQFGLCLDRPNVRFVVHWSMPMSIPQLFQETGRISQDGKKAKCRLYFSFEEVDNITTHIKTLPNVSGDDVNMVVRKYEFFDKVIDYCLGTTCRHVAQCAYLGQKVPRCQYYCDSCRDLIRLRSRIDKLMSYHMLTKKTLDTDLAVKQMKSMEVSTLKVSSNELHYLQQKSDRSGPTPEVRQRSYERLLEELKSNNENYREKIYPFIEDVSGIARKLEYSLCMGANCRQKYNHDVLQAIRIIREHGKSNSVCGYLKYFNWENEKLFNNREPEIVDLVDDESNKEPAVNNAVDENDESMIVCIDLAVSSSSGSETP